MQESDLSAVVAIAGLVHPDYPESPEVFAERLRLFEQGCWIAVGHDDGARGHARGYAIMHPAVLGQPPALNSLLHRLPVHADCLYLHDVALTEAARQSGLGGALVELIRQQALSSGYSHAALIAVNDSAAYWQRRGFSPYGNADAALAKKIASYDGNACYLVLKIDR